MNNNSTFTKGTFILLISLSNLFTSQASIISKDNVEPEIFTSHKRSIGSQAASVYVSFDAQVLDKCVLLSWVTKEHINSNYFEVERSFTGNNFSTIALVLDGFENGTNKDYRMKDYKLSGNNKTVFYRLKQFDNNGHFSYSNIITVNTITECK